METYRVVLEVQYEKPKVDKTWAVKDQVIRDIIRILHWAENKYGIVGYCVVEVDKIITIPYYQMVSDDS